MKSTPAKREPTVEVAESATGAPQEATEATQPPRSSRRVLGALGGVAAIVLILDVITKVLAVAYLEPGRPVEIIGDVVTLRLVRNSGAAFSMASGYTWVLTVIALLVVAGIIRYGGRLRSRWWVLGLGLVLGGAVGNLIDRFFREPGPMRGHVVDFVSVGWWPVFNVADPAVVSGAILLVVLSLFGFEYDGTRTGFAARTVHKGEGRNRDGGVVTDSAKDNDSTKDGAYGSNEVGNTGAGSSDGGGGDGGA